MQDYAARGQYGAGWMQGEKVIGYSEEKDVNPDSTTETFAAVKFYIDNWRWQNVPFYVRPENICMKKQLCLLYNLNLLHTYAFPAEAQKHGAPTGFQ